MEIRRPDGCDRCVLPHGMSEYPGEDVSDVEKRRRKEDFFNALVLTLDHDQPDDDRAYWNGDVAREAKQFEARSDANEFRDHVAEICDQDAEHHQKRDTEAVFFANQVAQTLASYGAHAGAHLLYHDEGERDGDHRPEEKKAVLGSGLRIGEDAAGIVVDVCRDDAR